MSWRRGRYIVRGMLTNRQPRRRRHWPRRLVTAAATLFVIGAVYLAIAALRGTPHASPAPSAATHDPLQQSVTPAVVDPNAPLQTLLDRLVAAKGDYAIAVAESDGRHASTNGDKQYTAASTYKLFIAYAVFQQVDSGELEWTDTVVSGRSAGECLRLMIVVSDNNCPEAFGDLIGWQKIDDMMDGLGLHNTRVKFHDNATTANDLALYLSKLLDGTLLSQVDSQTLLGYMKQQVYQDGIPAGTGVTVADKVGFLDDYKHDAGIVYGAKGPYVLVVMTDGSSWSQLADAAKQVHNFIENNETET